MAKAKRHDPSWELVSVRGEKFCSEALSYFGYWVHNGISPLISKAAAIGTTAATRPCRKYNDVLPGVVPVSRRALAGLPCAWRGRGNLHGLARPWAGLVLPQGLHDGDQWQVSWRGGRCFRMGKITKWNFARTPVDLRLGPFHANKSLPYLPSHSRITFSIASMHPLLLGRPLKCHMILFSPACFWVLTRDISCLWFW